MRNRGSTRLGWVVWMSVCLLLPASSGASETPAPDEAVQDEITQLPQHDYSEAALESLHTALEIYEALRAELAADRLQGVFVDSTRLAGALRMTMLGGGDLPGPIPETLKQTSLAAESLSEAEDLDTARIRFGDVSRLLLLVGSADPRLTEDRYVFACPMAQGFHKWIQVTETMANPYMGPSMLVCGAASDWPETGSSVETASGETALASARETAPSTAPSGPEPEFEPGIRGLEMVDVRDYKFLWREIEQLQVWEHGDRISIAEFRSKSIEKTAHFLGFGGTAADEFSAVAVEAVTSVRDSFRRGRETGNDPGGLQTGFSSDLDAARTRVISQLSGQPRHQLFEPECKKWLLKLAFGPREREEAEEIKQARASQADSGGGTD